MQIAHTELYYILVLVAYRMRYIVCMYRIQPEDVPLAILTQTGGLVVIVQVVYTRIKAG